jgi:hypothetical protein
MQDSVTHRRRAQRAAGVAAVLFALTAAAQDPKGVGGTPRGMPVKAAPVKVGTVNIEVFAVGTLLGNESMMVRGRRLRAASRQSISTKARWWRVAHRAAKRLRG